MLTITDAAEALFASPVQASTHPDPATVDVWVQATIRKLGGVDGCACAVAAEYGEYPDTAPTRMRWALTIATVVYGTAPTSELS